jgi:hypothetical protein
MIASSSIDSCQSALKYCRPNDIIRAKGFRRWLARRFFEETGGVPSSEALLTVLNVIEAKAHFDRHGYCAWPPERLKHAIDTGE